jgi:hypothetical protein
MKRLIFVIFFPLIFFSCEKEKQLIIENRDIPLISRVLIGDEIYMEYTYNDRNLVTEEKNKFHYARHTYNDNNQLITSDFYWDMRIASSNSSVLEAAMNREEWVNTGNTPKSISHVLEYNSKKHIIQKSFIRPEGKSDIVEFLYEGDRIFRATGYYNGIISGYTDYLYDDRGNVTRATRYIISSEGIAVLSTTTEYEFDDMHNPYLSFRRLLTPGIYTNSNNITKETYTINSDVDPSIEKVQVIENSFEYNDMGYPVKVNGLSEYKYK